MMGIFFSTFLKFLFLKVITKKFVNIKTKVLILKPYFTSMANKKYRVFIVEDKEIWAISLQETLGPNYEYHFFTSGEDCIANLNKNPDIIILDHDLEGQMDGLDALKAIKKRLPNVYVIMFTAQESIVRAVELFENGVFDYVVKSDNAAIRVKHHIKRIIELEEQKSQVIELKLQFKKWQIALYSVVTVLFIMLFWIYFQTCPNQRQIKWDPFGVSDTEFCHGRPSQ